MPTSETWIQHEIVNLEREQKKSRCQKHEQVLMFDLSLKANMITMQNRMTSENICTFALLTTYSTHRIKAKSVINKRQAGIKSLNRQRISH